MVIYRVISTEYSLEDWMLNPPDNTEWVDGELVKKNGVTLKHSRIQLKLDQAGRNKWPVKKRAKEGKVRVR